MAMDINTVEASGEGRVGVDPTFHLPIPDLTAIVALG